MDFCILGLLIMMPRSSYGLRQAFTQTLSLFYASSLGAVQATVKKLLGSGFIELSPGLPNPRGTKIWRVTPTGRAWFLSEMTADIAPGRLEETALARYHFLGLVPDSPGRCAVLELIVAHIEVASRGLDALQEHFQTMEIPEAFQDLAHYQQDTLDYGIKSHRHGLEWFRERLERERSKVNPGT